MQSRPLWWALSHVPAASVVSSAGTMGPLLGQRPLCVRVKKLASSMGSSSSCQGSVKQLRKDRSEKRMLSFSTEESSTHEETTFGYQTDSGFSSRGKDPQGLHNLSMIKLPRELQEARQELLKKYPRKVIQKDGQYLTRYLKNRGRPTERVKEKLKEYKTRMKDKSGLERKDEDEDLYADAVQHLEVLGGKTKDTQNNKPKASYIRYRERESVAYLASRMEACYGTTYRVLHEIKRREPLFTPRTYLDFGSGLGTATWAAHSLWGESIKEYQNVDISEDMMKINRFLLNGGKEEGKQTHIPTVFFSKFLPYSHRIKYDVVVAAYTLSELPTAKQRQIVIDTLWRKANDFLVIIEYGNNEGFEIMLNARDHVTKMEATAENETYADLNGCRNSASADGFHNEYMPGHVFAPCPHDTACARSEIDFRDHPCNFDQKVALSYAQKDTSLKRWGFAYERFSYVVLRKGEDVPNQEERAWPRLLKPVKKRKGHVICECCCPNGNIERHVLSKAKDKYTYKGIRHCAQLGDQVPPAVISKRAMQVIEPPLERVETHPTSTDSINKEEFLN